MLQVPGKLRAALRVAHDECARQLRRGFSIWLHGVDVARLEEARKAAQGASRLQRLDKALVAIEYTQYQLVRKVFVAWTDVFLHRKRSGRLTSFVGVALARATMIKAYHAWGRYVESHRRVRRTLKDALDAEARDELFSGSAAGTPTRRRCRPSARILWLASPCPPPCATPTRT